MTSKNTFNKKERLLQLPTKCSCNNLQKCFAISYKKVLQKTADEIVSILEPTGKTGVAFGLLMSRPGATVKVISEIDEYSEAKFRYYVGKKKQSKLDVVLHSDTPYNQWKRVMDASEDTCIVYYTSSPEAGTGEMKVTEKTVYYKSLMIDESEVNEEKSFFIRSVSPDEIEYTVAETIQLIDEQKIQKVKLGNEGRVLK